MVCTNMTAENANKSPKKTPYRGPIPGLRSAADQHKMSSLDQGNSGAPSGGVPPRRPRPVDETSDTYPTSDTVLEALEEAGLCPTRERIGLGRYSVRCPWAAEHPVGGSPHPVYLLPDTRSPYGEFECRGHAEPLHVLDLLDYVGVTKLDDGSWTSGTPACRVGPFDALAADDPESAEAVRAELDETGGKGSSSPPTPISPVSATAPSEPTAHLPVGGSEPAQVGRDADEMGERGDFDLPPPVSPVSTALPTSQLATAGKEREVASHVYTPAPHTNPVVSQLKRGGLYLRPMGDGAHAVTCPKASEHPPGFSAEAVYVEPTATQPFGRYACDHAHAERLEIDDLLDHLGLTPAQARVNARIRLHPGATHLAVAAAELVLAERPYFQSGGALGRIIKGPDGRASWQRLNDHTLSAVLATLVQWERKLKEGWVPCDPPRQVVQQLLFGHDRPHIRRLEGLAHQPFLRADGTLVTRPGYDPQTCIYAAFDAEDYDFGVPSEDTARASLAELCSLIREVSFATDADRSAALSLLLTAVIRPSLTQAPAFNITAPYSGSGKSHFTKLAALFASSAPAYSVSYPMTAEEAIKAVPSMLREKPAVILFDDMQTDWLPHGAINKALTSSTITERELGLTGTITVGTNALFMGTGNDIEPIGDTRRRVVSIRLEPDDDMPALRRFQSDPVAEVRRNRPRAVMAALEIIRAFQAAGSPTADVPPIGTFEEWSTWCRQPLLWLGLPDPATSLIKQVNHDADQDARKHFLIALREHFGSAPFLVQEIIKAADRDDELRDVLAELPVMAGNRVNAKKLGWHLKNKCQRPIGGLRVEPCDAPRQRRAWRIVKAGGGHGLATPDRPNETGGMGDRRLRPFSDEDDDTRPAKRAYAG